MRCPIYVSETEKCPFERSSLEIMRDHLVHEHQLRDVLNRFVGIIDFAEVKMKEKGGENGNDLCDSGYWSAMNAIVNPHEQAE